MKSEQMLRQNCKQMLFEGASIEDVLLVLRAETGKRTTSIKIVSKLLDVSIADAKKIVVTSPIWQDSLQSHIKLEDALSEPRPEIDDEC